MGQRNSNTNDGNDQVNYLRSLPIDTLMMWHIFDKHNLLHFTCCQLSAGQSASSHETPSRTTQTTPCKNQGSNEQLFRNQRGMVATVKTIGVSIAEMSKANSEMGRAAKIRRIDELRAERYRVVLAKVYASSPD